MIAYITWSSYLPRQREIWLLMLLAACLLTIQIALDMLKLSDRFGFELLKDTLGDKLAAEIDTKNILRLLTHADLHQATSLLKQCCVFIDQHAEDVLRSDAILDVSDHVLKQILSRDSLCVPEILVLQTVVRWKERNDVHKEAMKEVLDCVRLSEIPPRILFSEVERSCLFESESILKALRAQDLPDFELMRPRGIKCNYNTFYHNNACMFDKLMPKEDDLCML